MLSKLSKISRMFTRKSPAKLNGSKSKRAENSKRNRLQQEEVAQKLVSEQLRLNASRKLQPPPIPPRPKQNTPPLTKPATPPRPTSNTRRIPTVPLRKHKRPRPWTRSRRRAQREHRAQENTEKNRMGMENKWV